MRDFDFLFRLIMDNTPNLVFVKDERSVFRYANKALLEIFSPERRNKVVGYTTIEDFPDKEVALFIEEDKRALRVGQSEMIETITTYDGKKRVFHTRKLAFTHPNGEPCLLGICDDITDLAAREQTLVEMNEQLREFSALAAHDFRSPLSSYTSALHLIKRDEQTCLSPSADKYVDFMIDGMMNMSNSLNSILQSARATRKSQLSNAGKCDLNQMLTQIKFDLTLMLSQTQGSVNSDWLPMINADEPLFRQLFQNLIENSLKYRRPDQAPRILIRHETAADGIKLVFEDNGIGVESKNVSRIFDIFDQGEKVGFGGVGLGLSLCKRIVQAHGGTIQVDPDFTEGCRIVIELPGSCISGSEEPTQPSVTQVHPVAVKAGLRLIKRPS